MALTRFTVLLPQASMRPLPAAGALTSLCIQVLKVIRYTSKLVLVTALADSKTSEAKALKRFEASVATSRRTWAFLLSFCTAHRRTADSRACRKALRLGKWLADVNKVRRLPLDSQRNVVEAVAYLGEGCYYFLEQFTWCALVHALSAAAD